MKRRVIAAFSCTAQVGNIAGDPLWQVGQKGCEMCTGAQIAMHKDQRRALADDLIV